MNEYDITIIGSGPAGLTAAIYSAQAGVKVALITGEQFGGNLTKINNLTNYMGFSGIPGTEFIDKIQDQLALYQNLTIIYDKFVEYTNLTNISLHEIKLKYSQDKIISKSVIIATGLIPNTLMLTNESKFFGKGISFCATCDGPFFKGKEVVVVGGGNSAIEYATTLASYCKRVTIIHRRNEFRASKAMVDLLSKYDNIFIEFNSIVLEICQVDNKFDHIIIKNLNTSLEWILPASCMFYALGYINPNHMLLNDKAGPPGVFGAGDLVQQVHQVSVASSSGCIAALKAIEYIKQFK